MRIDFYFDFSCPYAYLGSTQIVEIATRHQIELRWCPMLLGGVFRAVGTPQNMSQGMPAAKAKHNLLDMHRWAKLWDVGLTVPHTHPMRTVAALRALLSTDESQWYPIIRQIYHCYWVDGGNIAESAVLSKCLTAAGLAPDQLEHALAANHDPAIKSELRKRTDDAISRGVFGAPTSFVTTSTENRENQHSEMFWGQDRLSALDKYLDNYLTARDMTQSDEPSAPRPTSPIEPFSNSEILFYFDFSSPFAYLAAQQIKTLAEKVNASLIWKPFLLGAVFNQVGTPLVPISAFSPAKRAYYRLDLNRSAQMAGTALTWNNHFPLRTVTALRLTLLILSQHPDHSEALISTMFSAAWEHGLDLNQPHVLADILAEQGLPNELLLAAKQPDAKQALFQATEEALHAGVFGAPTTIVISRDGHRSLFWGSDRLNFVERAAQGWRPDESS